MTDPLAILLADDALADITERPIAELRAYRHDATLVEGDISLARRLAQGRLDILGHEAGRRQGGGSGDELPADDLLYDLPDILADAGRGPGTGSPGRQAPLTAPGPVAELLVQRVDAAVSPKELAGVADLDDASLQERLDAVGGLERDFSDLRRQIHERIDAVQMEIGRRYRDGEASIDLGA